LAVISVLALSLEQATTLLFNIVLPLVECVSWMPLYLSFIKNTLSRTVYIST